jgi:hypothetical protein
MPTQHDDIVFLRGLRTKTVSVLLGASLLSLLSFGLPANAVGSWVTHDVTIRATGAPLVEPDIVIFAFASNLSREGPAGRVIYRSADNHINELKLVPSGWQWQDLTRLLQPSVPPDRTSALLAPDGEVPFGYVSNLPGRGPEARVVYRSADGHIQELNFAPDLKWRWGDLTDRTGAPVAAPGASPLGYESNLAGQGPMARVVYHSTDGNIQELSLGSDFQWRRADPDLTKRTGAPDAVGLATGFASNLAGQGAAAHVVYVSADGHVNELKAGGGLNEWRHTDLTVQTNGPMSRNPTVHGYTTSLSGQGQVARVVYVSSHDNHVQELFRGAGGIWRRADLTAVALWPQVPPPQLVLVPKTPGLPVGYSTNLAGQGPVARVVFRDMATRNVWELSVGSDGQWRGANLTARTGGGPLAVSEPFGYMTSLSGQVPTARVVFSTPEGHLQELSVS